MLVVPRHHVITLPELDPAEVGPYFERVQRVAAAMPEALDADGTFVAMNNVVSQSVAHLHCHVVPRRFKDGLRGFFWPPAATTTTPRWTAAARSGPPSHRVGMTRDGRASSR